jgi:quinol monooxygenase YgiN
VILATLRMIVRPEMRSALLEAIRAMPEPSQVERGCRSYRFYEDVENKNALVMPEEWANARHHVI